MAGKIPAFQRLPVKDETYITIWPPSRPHTPSHSHNLVATAWYMFPIFTRLYFMRFLIPPWLVSWLLFSLSNFVKLLSGAFNLYQYTLLAKDISLLKEIFNKYLKSNCEIVNSWYGFNSIWTFTDLTYHYTTSTLYCTFFNFYNNYYIPLECYYFFQMVHDKFSQSEIIYVFKIERPFE